VTDWVWIEISAIYAIHEEQLAEHGGGVGIRDIGLLESALGRPKNAAAYGDADVFQLAAAYGYGIAKNHPFIDGNKRTAFVATELFLELNGYELTADDTNCVMTMLAVAAGEMEESAFADWLRTHSAARKP
jgi:death on curing protein